MVEKPLFAVDVFPLKSNQSSPISGTYRLPSSGALSGSSGFPRADGQTQGLSEHGVPPIAKTVKMLKPLIFSMFLNNIFVRLIFLNKARCFSTESSNRSSMESMESGPFLVAKLLAIACYSNGGNAEASPGLPSISSWKKTTVCQKHVEIESSKR